MRTATRLGLVACLTALWTIPAMAQNVDVTFQVDMNAYITSCQFVPATGTVTVAGSINGWNTTANPLADADIDGIYTAVISVAPADIQYKFYATDAAVLGWEANFPTTSTNREFTVTPTPPTQTIPTATPNWTITNVCGASTSNYEIIFTADMRVQIASGNFDSATQNIAVAGAITDWGTNPVNLAPDPFETGVYTGIVQTVSPLVTPGETAYKFIIREQSDGSITTWESGDNRILTFTGGEPDVDIDGFRELTAPRRFFDDVTFDDVLSSPATVAFEVDLRPADYALLDNGSLPTDASGGGSITVITGLFVNGPFAGVADENTANIDDWATWGPSGLGSIPERQLFDDATHGDVTAGDRVFTLTYNFPTGTARRLVNKMGVDGYDNESAFGNDNNVSIEPGLQRLRHNFGCMRLYNPVGGLFHFEDNNGPGGPLFDAYLVIDNTLTTPVCSVVRNGGVDVANEPGTGPLAGVALGSAYPNPAASAARFEFTLDQAQAVTVRVFDVTGRAVATLLQGAVAAGTHTVTFESGSLPAGVYVYRLETAVGALTGRLTVAR